MARWIIATVVATLLAGAARASDLPSLKRQVIEFPAREQYTLDLVWEDVNGDRFADLLALSRSRRVLYIYLGAPSGFPESPNQTIQLPDDTLWVTARDVGGEAGKVILVSTSGGLSYYPHGNGVFEPELRELVNYRQVFEGGVLPHFLDSIAAPDMPKDAVPLVSSDSVVLYEPDADRRYVPAKTIALDFTSSMRKATWVDWGIPHRRSDGLTIRNWADISRSRNAGADLAGENEYVRKALEALTKDRGWWQYGIEDKDVNADGRKDLVLWSTAGDVNVRTTITVFIRRPDGKLPDKPSQTLRCAGMPAGMDNWFHRTSLVQDLDNDGQGEIVLMEMPDKFLSVSAAVDAALTRGIDWAVTIRRSNKDGVFAERPTFSMRVTTMLPFFGWSRYFVTFDGDFNGDDRKDLIVTRTPTQRDIYLSSGGSGSYDTSRKLTLEVPEDGRMTLTDLNGDGASDAVFVDYEGNKITVYFFESGGAK